MDTNSQQSSRIFSLSRLLCGELRLIIPDMQRDYCWPKDKAKNFISGIMQLYRRQHPATLGLLYGYENPIGSGCIHIIDGQQRITTLYLLIGMVFRRVPAPWLQQLLISDYELIDDRLPRLIYQAKHEAYYFMSDLVTRFFLNRRGRLSLLEKSDWYYDSYNSDLSVQCFISSIRAIDEELEAAAKRENFNFDDFANFIANNLSFLYCDLGDQQNAEKIFITINTTGEPLTKAQGQRAYAIYLEQTNGENVDAAAIWNEIEDWHWCHRQYGSTSIDDYLTLWESFSEKYPCSFYEFFKAYSRLADAIRLTPLQYPALPCIRHAMRFKHASAVDLARIWHFFSNIAQYQRPSASEDDISFKLIDSLPSPDLLSVLGAKVHSARFLNAEEKAKLEFLRRHIDMRPKVEALITQAEAHPMLNGRAAKLIEWSRGKIEDFELMVKAIYDIWGDNIDKNPNLDLLRRALLTFCHSGYPIVRRGETILSLCWNDYDWQRLMLFYPEIVRQVIDATISNLNPDGVQYKPKHTLSQMIERFNNSNYPYFFLIKNQKLLSSIHRRQLMRPCDVFIGFYDLEQESTRWYIEQKEIILPNNWKKLRAYGNRCLYTDHIWLNVAIDIYFHPAEKKKYRIEVFNRPDSDKRPCDIKIRLADLLGIFNRDRSRNRWVANFSNLQQLRNLLPRLFNAFEISNV